MIDVEVVKLITHRELDRFSRTLSTNHSIPIEVAKAIYISTLSFMSSVINADTNGEELRVLSLRKAFNMEWRWLDEAFKAEGRVERAVIDAIEMVFSSLPSRDDVEKKVLAESTPANERPI